ncbi:MAG: hypothetical protein OES57_09905 [Acidimicrobiia bacterium]|nr:hypothetical protein [Acidimicrobiia bacterium]
MPDSRQSQSYVWTDVGRLLRYWWVLLIAAGAAAALALALTGDVEEEVRARQAMTLVGARWDQIQTAHEQNAAYVLDEVPAMLEAETATTGVAVELERPGEPQSTAFFVIATASTESRARAGADATVAGLVDSQSRWAVDAEQRRAVVVSAIETAEAELVEIESGLAFARAESSAIEAAEGYTAEVDRLGGEIALAEQRRRQVDNDIAALEDELVRIDADSASQPTVATVGAVRIEADSPSLSRSTIALLAAFGAALVASIAALAWDRRRGRLTSERQLARLVPELPVANVNRGAEAGAALAELAAAARRLVDARADSVVIVGTTADADGGRIADMLRNELREAGDDGSVKIVQGTGDRVDLSLWSAAHSSEAIVAVASGARGSTVVRTVNRLEQLKVEVLLVALAGRRGQRPATPITTVEAASATALRRPESLVQ